MKKDDVLWKCSSLASSLFSSGDPSTPAGMPGMTCVTGAKQPQAVQAAQRKMSVWSPGLQLVPVLHFPIFSLIAFGCSPDEAVGWVLE